MSKKTIAYSVSEASSLGVSGIVKTVDELDTDVVIEKHGKRVAKVISYEHAEALEALEEDLRLAALALSRSFAPKTSDLSIKDLAEELGFDFDELVAEVDTEMASAE